MNDYEIISKLLFEKYGKVALTPEETFSIIGASKKALETDRYNATGIQYTRRSNKERSQVLYTITAIVKHLVDNQIKIVYITISHKEEEKEK